MLNRAIVEKTLKEQFTPSIRQRGLMVQRLGMVESLEFETNRSIWGEVWEEDEIYEVHLEIDHRFKRITTDCDCWQKSGCMHQAAALYELKDAIDHEMIPENLLRVISVKKKAPKMENKSAGTYRKIPLTDNLIFAQFIDQLTDRDSPSLSWNESFEGRFISENEIELRSISIYANYRFEDQKILIKKEGIDFLVKCLTCKQKSNTLCPHQFALLDNAKEVLMDSFFKTGFDYQTVINKGVETTGVMREAFDQYFNVIINTSGVNIKAKGENFYGSEWLETTQALMQISQKNRKENIKNQTQVLEENRNKKFAFLWTLMDERADQLGLFFVKGFGFKTKEGIHATNRQIEEIPRGFPEPYQNLGQELFFLIEKENHEQRFKFVQEFIQKYTEEFNGIYQYIYVGSPNYNSIRASNLHLVTFHPVPLECQFKIYRKDGLIYIERRMKLEDQSFKYDDKIIFSNDVFCASKTMAYLLPSYHFLDIIRMFGPNDTLILPFTNKIQYTQLINGLKKYFDVEADAELVLEEELLEKPTYQILLREAGQFVLFEPRLKYGEFSFNAYDDEDFEIREKVFRVDEADRIFLIQFLENSHPDFKNGYFAQEYVFLDVKSMINDYWFIHFNEACEAAGIEVLGQDKLTKFKYTKHRAATYSHVKSGIDWFEVDMGISFGKEKIKTADWIRALRNKESFVKLKDGSLGMLPEEWIKQARKIMAVAEIDKDKLTISKYRFNIIEDLFEKIDDKKMIEELKAKKKQLANINLNQKYELPSILNATLRDYQKDGFAWLKFLDESGFGGILADDMGLGKTLQVISLLADQIDKEPSIVVVPRSLLFNWAAELEKFCEKIKYVIHHGSGRAKTIHELLPLHVIITTYGTAAADVEMFKDFKFNYIILDESQAIKNPNSKRYKAMRLLQSNNKLAMTGTPIENNTFDLYAQLSFTSPGLLGTQTSFKNNFAIPIDNHGDKEAATLLRKLIHPFLLRRTKQQVAKDLPEKTESIIYCEMGATQRKLYDNLKRKIKEDIEETVEEKGVAKSKFQMLDGLLRLRQMCNSPLLLNASFSGRNAESVKINILIDHLTENMENHNALIFSQFVSLLSILREELDKRQIKYAYLDGSTTKRQAEVEKFMDNEEVKVFLISIKAGNTGMNLTKADYVYILDPWWNPAVEAQAIDRTHRIGQDKQIFAYKLICKNSIEEKILKLQEKKKNLADDLIRTDENIMKSLNKKELMSLFD